jgi:four helix bundle protein
MFKIMSYKNLEIWSLAESLVKDIHQMTLECLPAFEHFETGSQIRRSTKSIKSNIVEGYGRKNYPKEYIRFLNIAGASLDESKDHLETLYITGSLKDKARYERLHQNMEILGRKLYRFIQVVKQDC